MGLSVTYSIIEKYSSTIYLKLEPNGSASITLYIPCK